MLLLPALVGVELGFLQAEIQGGGEGRQGQSGHLLGIGPPSQPKRYSQKATDPPKTTEMPEMLHN
jgi:hypothetical protein